MPPKRNPLCFWVNFLPLLLLIVVFPAPIKSEIEERLKNDFFCIYTHTALIARNITKNQVTPDQITYHLITNKLENITEISPQNHQQIDLKTKRIAILIHGWTENRNRSWYADLTTAFLAHPEHYDVIQIDWSEPADQYYTISSYNTKDVGEIIGRFLIDLHSNESISLDNVILIGHSLGGQVSGYVGKTVIKNTGRKLPRIIALDPAGPLFTTRPEHERLNPNDADVVEVVHTDGGTFGYKAACGTIDFFPNGGQSQPGCTRIDLLDVSSVTEAITCDHHRSWEYYIEAVLNPNEFLGGKCKKGWIEKQIRRSGGCDDEEGIEKTNLGDLEVKKTGEFYLETNNEKPFSRKRDSGGLGVVKVLQPRLPRF